jgi:hypothetical protein
MGTTQGGTGFRGGDGDSRRESDGDALVTVTAMVAHRKMLAA